MLRIEHVNGVINSGVTYDHVGPRGPLTEGMQFTFEANNQTYETSSIETDLDSEFAAMAICHELAHVLIAIHRGYLRNKQWCTAAQNLKEEVLAWRIARTFCKPKFWHDEFVKTCLLTYMDYYSPEVQNAVTSMEILPFYSWGRTDGKQLNLF